MEIDVFTEDTYDQWQERFDSFDPALQDIFYTPNYLRTWEEHDQGKAHCLSVQSGSDLLLYPFLLRPIPQQEGYFDASSAYGYGGLIANKDNPRPQLLEDFNRAIDAWMREQQVVGEFVRENPGMHHGECLRETKQFQIRTNVYAQLGDEPYRIPSQRGRRGVNTAIKKGLKVEIDDDLETMDQFEELYLESFHRIRMSKYYLFPTSYYEMVRKLLKQNTQLVNIKLGDELVASAIFLYKGNKGNYHLGCSKEKYLRDDNRRPNDMLMKAMIDQCQNLGLKWMSLGGGIGNDENDSLYQFKKKFCNFERPVYIGKKTHHQDVYDELCATWEKEHPALKDAYENYFLKYRIDDKN